jgi:hypothetical protein
MFVSVYMHRKREDLRRKQAKVRAKIAREEILRISPENNGDEIESIEKKAD